VVFQDVINQAKAAGKTVLLSSHILAQVEKLCDRISIIRLGRIVQSGTLSDMRHLTRTTIEAETGEPATGLAQLTGVHDVRNERGKVHFNVDSAHLDGAVRHLAQFGVRSLVSHPPTLEELMLRHYGDELAANGHPADVDIDADGAKR
jgi:ABC-2 type transport system ATP-binding protein